MRRWLLAVFVLPLFWNMATVAIGAQPHERPGDAHAPAVLAMADALSSDAKGLVNPTHGLIDELPELPDSMARAPVRGHTPATPPTHAGGLSSGSRAPWPQGLFRPPQRA